jgi:hypothetical protein
MKKSIFWDITLCSQLTFWRIMLLPASGLKMEVTCSSEMSVALQKTTLHYIAEDRTLDFITVERAVKMYLCSIFYCLWVGRKGRRGKDNMAMVVLLAGLHVTCFLKPLKVVNFKISSTSLVYAHYLFQPTLVIFRCLQNRWWNCCAAIYKFSFWGMPSSMLLCVLWWWVVPFIGLCVAVMNS